VKKLKKAGKTMKEIMAATDLSRASVYRALDR
jgi:predicted DNA-binding transcriptional regulator AlpA